MLCNYHGNIWYIKDILLISVSYYLSHHFILIIFRLFGDILMPAVLKFITFDSDFKNKQLILMIISHNNDQDLFIFKCISVNESVIHKTCCKANGLFIYYVSIIRVWMKLCKSNLL